MSIQRTDLVNQRQGKPWHAYLYSTNEWHGDSFFKLINGSVQIQHFDDLWGKQWLTFLVSYQVHIGNLQSENAKDLFSILPGCVVWGQEPAGAQLPLPFEFSQQECTGIYLHGLGETSRSTLPHTHPVPQSSSCVQWPSSCFLDILGWVTLIYMEFTLLILF